MSVKRCHGNAEQTPEKRARGRARPERRAVMGDNAGSTPGNPHAVDGEGPDIFQRMPNNIPPIRRSANRLRGETPETERVKPSEFNQTKTFMCRDPLMSALSVASIPAVPITTHVTFDSLQAFTGDI